MAWVLRSPQQQMPLPSPRLPPPAVAPGPASHGGSRGALRPANGSAWSTRGPAQHAKVHGHPDTRQRPISPQTPPLTPLHVQRGELDGTPPRQRAHCHHPDSGHSTTTPRVGTLPRQQAHHPDSSLPVLPPPAAPTSSSPSILTAHPPPKALPTDFFSPPNSTLNFKYFNIKLFLVSFIVFYLSLNKSTFTPLTDL